MKLYRRILAGLLSTVMCAQLAVVALPQTVLAAEADGVSAAEQLVEEGPINDSVLTYELHENTLTITGLMPSYQAQEGTVLLLPSTMKVDGVEYPITAIGPKAFANRAGIAVLILPKALNEIGQEAFAGMPHLQGILSYGSVRTVGANAFAGLKDFKLGLAESTDPASPLAGGMPYEAWMKGLSEELQQAVVRKLNDPGEDATLGSTESEPETPSETESQPEATESEIESQPETTESEVSFVEFDSSLLKEARSLARTEEEKVKGSIQLATKTVSIYPKKTAQILATATPGNAVLTYRSSNTAIAKVNSVGMVTGVAAGKTTITVALADQPTVKATVSVTIKQPVTRIKLSKSSVTLSQGKTLTLSAAVTPTNAANRGITYSSNDTAVAKVDSAGKITAVSGGTAVISAKAKDGMGASATCIVTVKSPISFDINTTVIPMKIGKTYRIYPTIKSGNKASKFTYSSSSSSIAKVSSSGVVTAVADGRTSIRIKASDGVNSTTRTITVIVYKNAKAFGVDVSTYNGYISVEAYKRAKAEGVDFVMVRAGYGKEKYDEKDLNKEEDLQTDVQFENNYRNAKAAGLDVGVYHYSYATTVANMELEAKAFLKRIEGKSFEYPAVLDFEDKIQTSMGKTTCTKLIDLFCKRVQEVGYFPSVYSFTNFLQNSVDRSVLNKYDVWIAHPGTTNPNSVYTGEFGMWQFSWEGRIDGLYGNGRIDTVDVNLAFKDYPALTSNPPKPTEPSKPNEPDGSTNNKFAATVSLNSGTLNIRTGPGTSYSTVGSYKNGANITVTQVSGKWCKTSKGWVSGDYLKAKKGTVIDTDVLNVRKSYTSSSDKVATLKRGAAVKIYNTKNGWYYTSAGGWVSGNYLKVSGTLSGALGYASSSSSSGSTAPASIKVSNKVKLTSGSLNIRKGAGTSYPSVGTYKNGTALSISSVSSKWLKTTKGWVSGDYVSATTAKVVDTSTLTVRKSYSSTSTKVGSVGKGATVKVYAAKSGWYLTDRGGWVSGKYLKAN